MEKSHVASALNHPAQAESSLWHRYWTELSAGPV